MSDTAGCGPWPGTGIVGGVAEGEALVADEALGFNLGVDERNGVVIERGHAWEGLSLAGKVLVFPGCKGSGAGSYSLYQIVKEGYGPVAMVNDHADSVGAAGAVLAEIPLVHRLESEAMAAFQTGQRLRVDGDKGEVAIVGDESGQ